MAAATTMDLGEWCSLLRDARMHTRTFGQARSEATTYLLTYLLTTIYYSLLTNSNLLITTATATATDTGITYSELIHHNDDYSKPATRHTYTPLL